MVKVDISGYTVSPTNIIKAFRALVEMPVSSVADFQKRRRCIEVLSKDFERSLEFESEDFNFLKSQFEWGLSNRALAGNDTWEVISLIFEGVKK